ncbi:MAG: FAD-dependent thymidylate synthase [Clostridiales bacterium]|nr:FAD-dependent thymidylate synthase [Clostridiales bacterium]
MNITLLKYPTDEDWAFAKQCALVTIGKEMKTAPDMAWKHAILRARHSPIRALQFAFYLEGVPYWVSTHLARHVHAQPFIRSQRNDRQDEYDRNAARQDAPVDMIWYMNAEELMTIAEKRICKQAAKETREVVLMMRWLVVNHCPEFEGLLEPHCTKYGDCPEMKPCETGRRLQGGNDSGN